MICTNNNKQNKTKQKRQEYKGNTQNQKKIITLQLSRQNAIIDNHKRIILMAPIIPADNVVPENKNFRHFK